MLYKEGIPFEQHTPRLYEQCFNKMDIELCTALAKKVNEEQYGDMAVFSFRKKTKAEMLQEEKEKQEEVGKEKLLLLMEEAVLYLIQQREAKQLEKAAFLLNDLLDASRVLQKKMMETKIEKQDEKEFFR